MACHLFQNFDIGGGPVDPILSRDKIALIAR